MYIAARDRAENSASELAVRLESAESALGSSKERIGVLEAERLALSERAAHTDEQLKRLQVCGRMQGIAIGRERCALMPWRPRPLMSCCLTGTFMRSLVPLASHRSVPSLPSLPPSARCLA